MSMLAPEAADATTPAAILDRQGLRESSARTYARWLPIVPVRASGMVGIGGVASSRLGAIYVERMLDDPSAGVVSPAAMLVEPVQGEGGVIAAPDEWMREMRRITAERGIPLIVDEVQTGVGRTGAMWAIEHSGVIPDVLVLSRRSVAACRSPSWCTPTSSPFGRPALAGEGVRVWK